MTEVLLVAFNRYAFVCVVCAFCIYVEIYVIIVVIAATTVRIVIYSNSSSRTSTVVKVVMYLPFVKAV